MKSFPQIAQINADINQRKSEESEGNPFFSPLRRVVGYSLIVLTPNTGPAIFPG
jgi:hypothetical protein